MEMTATATRRQYRSWLSSIQQIVFPATCMLCGDRGLANLDLCGDCIASLPWDCEYRWSCMHTESGTDQGPCPCILEEQASLSAVHSLFRYEGVIPQLLQRIKFGRDPVPCRTLGSLWAMAVGHRPKPDVLIPVPLHTLRQAWRGFNQSQLLAAALGRALGVAVDPLAVRRTRATHAQSRLDREARQTNLSGAFGYDHLPAGRQIVIIDDVYTTGATTRAVSDLLEYQSHRVSVWTLARA